jgi:DNA-binding HxlR family transcriptional regulator
MLFELAAGLDYRGLYELAMEGIPGMPPVALPSPEELEEKRERELAEFKAEREEESEQARAAEANRKLELTPLGLDTARCHLALKRWLAARPGGPPRPDSLVAEALGPLLCGWSGTIVHALAPEPATLDELDRAVTLLDREDTQEHVERMVRSGMAAAQTEAGVVRYALTGWGRAAIAPIVAAVHYERRHDEETTLAPDVFDVEAGFQMALPLLRLPAWLRGSCRLGVQIPGDEPLIAGATVQIDAGVVASSSPLLEEAPGTWVSGDALGWCETVIDPDADKLNVGGDTELAEALIAALHERLFGAEVA